jgi:anti-sigma factor RsiW
MTCPSGEIWTAYADDEAPRAELPELEAHLAGCPDCRSVVLALREENRLLARVLDEIPDAGRQRSVGLPGVTVGVGTLVASRPAARRLGLVTGLGREAPRARGRARPRLLFGGLLPAA